MYLYGAGGHSKVIAEILESIKLYTVSLMTINALKKLGDKGRKGIQFRAKIPSSFRVSCNNCIGNNNERQKLQNY
jgi:hypothetical protein